MTEPTEEIVSIKTVNGYGSWKRGDRCEISHGDGERKVPQWEVTYRDGAIKRYCDDHVPSPSGATSP